MHQRPEPLPCDASYRYLSRWPRAVGCFHPVPRHHPVARRGRFRTDVSIGASPGWDGSARQRGQPGSRPVRIVTGWIAGFRQPIGHAATLEPVARDEEPAAISLWMAG